jgi:DNA-binding LacI/PurR family transcriptional regulator
MPRKKKNHSANKSTKPRGNGRVSLRELAAHLDLSPTALSLVLNDAPAATAIPQETKDKIFAAAAEFNYRPNYFARSLRAQRSFTLGVLVPELSDGYSAMVLSGVEAVLLNEGYFYLLASHRHRENLIHEYPNLFHERGVEGIIAVDTPYQKLLPLPTVTISGQTKMAGVTNVALNHERAAEIALEHLLALGHRRIAFLKGQAFSSDTEIRWQAILAAARRRRVAVRPSLTAQLEGDSPSPETGYVAAKKILARGESFTALFAFNDVSAIGAMRALAESGRSVPADVSVLGFDDVYAAAFHLPALTTVRQPLFEMGRIAAETLLKRLASPDKDFPSTIWVEPKLIVRQSTAPLSGKK